LWSILTSLPLQLRTLSPGIEDPPSYCKQPLCVGLLPWAASSSRTGKALLYILLSPVSGSVRYRVAHIKYILTLASSEWKMPQYFSSCSRYLFNFFYVGSTVLGTCEIRTKTDRTLHSFRVKCMVTFSLSRSLTST
jgi:hypothetical protein